MRADKKQFSTRLMAALMADPESEHGAMKEEAKESEAAE